MSKIRQIWSHWQNLAARVRKETKRMGEEVAAAAAHQHIKRCLPIQTRFAYH